MRRSRAAWLIVLVGARVLCAQTASVPVVTSVREPGVYSLDRLYGNSDLVIKVRILSGDAEHYDGALYKATVVRNFKGSVPGQVIYFGPYVGGAVGSEYVLFLQAAPAPAVAKPNQNAGYGPVPWYRVFDEGYSSMAVTYECRFSGKDPVQSCSNAVRVCTDYIRLPANTSAVPPMTEETDFGCRWVRETEFTALLDGFKLAVH